MKHYLSFLLIIVITSVNAQVVKNNHVIMGDVESINSKILNENRKIWVYLPVGANSSAQTPKQRYPVVYLLDGDTHFASVTGMIQQLSEANGNTICPEMIVVAIPNTNRRRDLTPTNAAIGPDGKKLSGYSASGGEEQFTAFIEKELMPHIDSIYPTAPYKILIGHSLGGLAVINILINHTGLFNAYVAIDPSMWWDNRKLINQAREVLKRKNFDGKSLFLGIANTMPAGMDILNVRRDTSGTTGHIRSILELLDILKNNPKNGLNWGYRYYNGDSHDSAPLITEYDALHFLFSYYSLSEDIDELMTENSKINPASLISRHYTTISQHFGYKVLPQEAWLNWLGYYYLQNNMTDGAYGIFNLNIQYYPDSFYVYSSMADYYNFKKNKIMTVEFYNKALKVKENPEMRAKLNRLLAEK